MREIDYEWIVLDPEAFYGSVGTKFQKEKDKSLLALGSNPPTSGYSVSAKTTLTNITGFRLEVLIDPIPDKSGGLETDPETPYAFQG